MLSPDTQNEASLAYAAGLFDGEGSVGVYIKSNGSIDTAQLTMGMVDPKPVLFMQALFGGGVIKLDKSSRGYRTAWQWSIHSDNALNAAKLMLPYSITKASELRLFVRFMSLRVKKGKSVEHMQERQMIADTIKHMKQLDYGHLNMQNVFLVFEEGA